MKNNIIDKDGLLEAFMTRDCIPYSENENEKNLNNVLLRFYLTFNIFESFFYEKPKWKQNRKGQGIEKTNKQRHELIQAFCNKKKYEVTPTPVSDPLNDTTIKIFEFQNHFRHVYFKNKELTKRGNSLRKTKMNTRILSDFLHADISKDKKQKAIAISDALFLCYFFRNNLFHGTKHIYQLKDYIDDFIQIENFMTSLMKYLAQNESEKY